jgi:hypothetical protein
MIGTAPRRPLVVGAIRVINFAVEGIAGDDAEEQYWYGMTTSSSTPRIATRSASLVIEDVGRL